MQCKLTLSSLVCQMSMLVWVQMTRKMNGLTQPMSWRSRCYIQVVFIHSRNYVHAISPASGSSSTADNPESLSSPTNKKCFTGSSTERTALLENHPSSSRGEEPSNSIHHEPRESTGHGPSPVSGSMNDSALDLQEQERVAQSIMAGTSGRVQDDFSGSNRFPGHRYSS